ncbi:hypothetical protein [Legionella sainthelensi]|uniref:Uncharacterized protein n=1 Tax=Legionella sainthelensi TaxID=28087 RepID=A0A2H5FPB7_9GAMM|nr:hypothetical protein [Legionella sainthelensi]AUH73405.1 hypothetical protein CAB17_16100 [Legionella sainthelensi]
MLLKYELEDSPESVVALIKAANTDNFVQFENGERCKVISPSLTPTAKLDLLNKIEKSGIDFFYCSSVGTQKFTMNHTIGFFHHKAFKIKVLSQDIRNASLYLKDGTEYTLAFQIVPLLNSSPKSEMEESDFIAAGGEITQGYCIIL